MSIVRDPRSLGSPPAHRRWFRPAVEPTIIVKRHSTFTSATVLFYNPEDPPLMPLEASRALHRSQLLPSGVLVVGSLAWLASGDGGPHPLLRLPLELLFGVALAVSVAVPMWIGIVRARLSTGRLSPSMPRGSVG